MIFPERIIRSLAGNRRALTGARLYLYLLALLVCFPQLAAAQISVLTQHYDNARTGQNTNETILTTSNVNPTTFGKVGKFPVDGYLYAQPLYVPNVTIPGLGSHNVVYVATEHDSVYAFDADNYTPLWHVSFLINGATPAQECSFAEVGITGTPAIDPSTETLYVVAQTVESGTYVHRLHALDITTGGEKFGGPVILQASVPGTGTGGDGTMIKFMSQYENQRPGLLLQNGYVHIAFGSFCDMGPYHGWFLSYNASTLVQSGAWATTPNGQEGGMWNAGTGIAGDASGNAFVATSNGDFPSLQGLPWGMHAPPPSTSVDFSDSVVRLSLAGGIPVPEDYFTPYDQKIMYISNLDLGSGGVILLPDQPGLYPHILLTGGKLGEIYVLNRDQLTSDNTYYCNGCLRDREIIQTFDLSQNEFAAVPAYWNGNVYFWANGDNLKACSMIDGQISPPTSKSHESASYPGSTPVVSSNGATNGIVWAVDRNYGGPTILRAFDATNVANLLYGSDHTKDTLGDPVKFAAPIVANGKVYVGTQEEVDVFGLLGMELLLASKKGTGSGTVTSGDDDINCGNTCSYNYAPGTPVTLTATPAQGSMFTRFSGCDSTQGNSCTLVMNGPRTVTVTFTKGNICPRRC